MKKENVRKMTVLFLAMGLMGIGGMPARAADLTVEKISDLQNADNFIQVSGDGTCYRPSAGDNENTVVIDMNKDKLIGHSIAAGQGRNNVMIVKSGIFGIEGADDTGEFSYVYGSANGGLAENNAVYIHGGTFYQSIDGGEARGPGAAVHENSVYMDGGKVYDKVVGGWLTTTGIISSNQVTIEGTAEAGTVCGGHSVNGTSDNRVTIEGRAKVDNVYGGFSTGNGDLLKNEVQIGGEATITGVIHGGYSEEGYIGNAVDNSVTISDSAKATGTIYGGCSNNTGKASGNQVILKGHAMISERVYGGYSTAGESTGNSISISDQVVTAKGVWIMGGGSGSEAADTNKVDIFGGTVNSHIAGGYGVDANQNTVALMGGIVKASVYGGYRSSGTANNNTITLKNDADVSGANLYGSNLSADQTGGNTLIIDGWNSSSANGNAVKKVKNFDEITFRNLAWKNDGIALNITDADTSGQLKDTQVNVENLTLDGDIGVKAGDKMTFIQSNADTGLSMEHVQLTEDASFSQGVATVGKLDVKLEGATNNLIGEIKSVSFNPQTDVIAENRTAAAAFLNQGADIAADSLDLLGSDYKYGLRTFGAVYGNRSTYDSAGDVKINGWSEIVGLGNVHRKGDGDLAWGVFYENGTGNYRTWNQFNNEMFRGDGSLRYNGGGAAVRYTRDSGWYYEASVRAGTLSALMENAVKDGEGNSYGFDNDSTYWGVHAGIGRLIDTERGEWNLYGKYFHTDIEGSSFSIAKDRFVFDSLDSDRLRLGARYTADKTKRWSLYYGLAWEYEFSGDSHMRAAQWNAPEQSLGGSTGIAEIGTVWQPDDSPWQADINIKGYTGEREGFSGMVQLAYTF